MAELILKDVKAMAQRIPDHGGKACGSVGPFLYEGDLVFLMRVVAGSPSR